MFDQISKQIAPSATWFTSLELWVEIETILQPDRCSDQLIWGVPKQNFVRVFNSCLLKNEIYLEW